MTRENDFNQKPGRGVVWSLIGYTSFAILGILIGAVMVYALVSIYLQPPAPDAIPEPREEEQVEEPAPEPDTEHEPEVEPDPIPDFEIPLLEIADVVEKVLPSVVGINERGSGVIISDDGYILTNQHVIEEANDYQVLIPGMGRYDAELIGEDALTDLALLKINERGLRHVDFANSDELRIGEAVLAIGNPLGLQQTVTAGIISAVQRQIWLPGTEYAHTFIQTDALINPGNSGGPLVNLQGDIVGINTAKIALLGVEGIGLSIPSNTARRIVDDFFEFGKVFRPHMGVFIEDWIDLEHLNPEMGILIVDILSESPAEEAGLKPDDILVAVDDREVNFLAQLFDTLLAYYPGDTIEITFYRDGERKTTDLLLEERPE